MQLVISCALAIRPRFDLVHVSNVASLSLLNASSAIEASSSLSIEKSLARVGVNLQVCKRRFYTLEDDDDDDLSFYWCYVQWGEFRT